MTYRSLLRDAMLTGLARALPRPAHGDSDRVLILQPDHMGDIILSEPAVRLIRQHRPDARLTAVVGPWSAAIAKLAWPVDGVVTIEFPGFNRAETRANPLDPYARLARDAGRLRSLHASDAVVLRDDAWWATALARASVSGTVVASSDPRNRHFATQSVELNEYGHNTTRAVALAASLMAGGGPAGVESDWDMSPRVAVMENYIREASRLLEEACVSGPFIVIHPGAGAPVKTWPARYWRVVIESLADHQVVITGGDAEATECAAIAEDYPHVANIAGRTSLEALIGLFSSSVLAIGTDNGPMHLAAATGTPTIRLFGPSSPHRYGPPPGSSLHRVINVGWSCPRCEDLSLSRAVGCGCMTAITPAMVIDAIKKTLSNAT